MDPRCAHLLDAFAVDAKTVGALDALMQRLREVHPNSSNAYSARANPEDGVRGQAEPAFEDVRAVYEPISGQMLFVNRAVLARVLAECAADPPWTTFVDISTSLTRVSRPIYQPSSHQGQCGLRGAGDIPTPGARTPPARHSRASFGRPADAPRPPA